MGVCSYTQWGASSDRANYRESGGWQGESRSGSVRNSHTIFKSDFSLIWSLHIEFCIFQFAYWMFSVLYSIVNVQHNNISLFSLQPIQTTTMFSPLCLYKSSWMHHGRRSSASLRRTHCSRCPALDCKDSRTILSFWISTQGSKWVKGNESLFLFIINLLC